MRPSRPRRGSRGGRGEGGLGLGPWPPPLPPKKLPPNNLRQHNSQARIQGGPIKGALPPPLQNPGSAYETYRPIWKLFSGVSQGGSCPPAPPPPLAMALIYIYRPMCMHLSWAGCITALNPNSDSADRTHNAVFSSCAYFCGGHWIIHRGLYVVYIHMRAQETQM